MAGALAHRGPDAEGVWIDAGAAPSVGLAHRRLSIIDLSHVADQPIGNEDGTVLVMLNGEIYNFAELRARAGGAPPLPLARRHRGRSCTATRSAGEEIVARLDGMFALALWDARRRRLLLARDPFGKKPLYYWTRRAARCVFASEIKALLAGGRAAPRSTRRALPEYLAFGYVPTPRTLFRGIRKLPPASMLVADAQGVHEPHVVLGPALPGRRATSAACRSAEAADRVRELLDATRCASAWSPTCRWACCSRAAWTRARWRRSSPARPRRPSTTFTLGFEGDAFYDERAARGAGGARTSGPTTTRRWSRPQRPRSIETLLHHHDEPFGDSSALPTYLVAREARQHVTVALNGDGGDETFAGYERFRAELIAHRTARPVARVPERGRGVPAPGRRRVPRHACAALRRFARKVGAAVRRAHRSPGAASSSCRPCAPSAATARRPRRRAGAPIARRSAA